MSLPGAAPRPPKVLAMGGGGFTMHERSPVLDRYVLTLTERPVPRICFIPTASGDPLEQASRFLQRFGGWTCEPTVLSLFHLGRDRTDPVRHLLAQDAVYVGGGSMRNMLAIWREHRVDRVMRAAWLSGTVLAGLSAGAMCWFQGGISKSGGRRSRSPGWASCPAACPCTWTGSPTGCRSSAGRWRPVRCRPATPPTTALGWCSAVPGSQAAWPPAAARGSSG